MSDPAAQPEQRTVEARVGPGPGHATVRAALLPFACWRVEDVRFAFDSSIIAPEVAPELAALAGLVEQNTVAGRRPTASIFGHADPSGGDDYNHALSGRRAQAVYALLTRRVDLWEALHEKPHGGDDWKGDRAVRLMLGRLGYGDDPAERRRFQADRGLTVDGAIGPLSRAALFKDYMDALCPLTLAASDFLGRGADPGGKADFQGCGELNPALVSSQAEAQALQKDPAARRAQDAPNRRVMVFLFRPGTHVDPTRWPCPRAGEGLADCKRRLWSDGEARRAPGATRRTFGGSRDTFACRFYHRLSDRSPCEGVLPALRLRLYDAAGKAVPRAPYRVIVAGEERRGIADDRGVLRERFSRLPELCTVQWGAAPAAAPPAPGVPLDFSSEVHPRVDPLDDGVERAIERLRNLGYKLNGALEDDVLAFQVDFQPRFGLALDGQLDGPTRAALRKVHGAAPDDLHASTS